MSRRTLLAIASWLAAALVAVVVGIVAIQLVGASITGTSGGVRSQDDIERALAAAPMQPTRATSPSPSPGSAGEAADPAAGGPTVEPTRAPVRTPNPAATSRTPPVSSSAPARNLRREFVVEGGSVVAECVGRQVRLVTWSPARGYRIEEVDRGPDEDVSVTFDGEDDDKLSLQCVRGLPEVVADEDD